MCLFLGFKLQRIHKLSRIILRICYKNIHVHIICLFAVRQENWQHKMVINILEVFFPRAKKKNFLSFQKRHIFLFKKNSTSSWFLYEETVCAIFALLFYTYLVQYMQMFVILLQKHYDY